MSDFLQKFINSLKPNFDGSEGLQKDDEDDGDLKDVTASKAAMIPVTPDDPPPQYDSINQGISSMTKL